ncbi:hypothetical protein [Methanosphaera sp. BMS]|uniref:hypothetical protein n=1 Tax=Methanosphaera sp. BMS TaxID=1789762 RepID=UPI000DC1C379|nr:hypothetical protein [Methanosphaera sp. BMS]AWX33038.1 hypothetical protein AW729_07985 [Methanosphaera sp. BMS]
MFVIILFLFAGSVAATESQNNVTAGDNAVKLDVEDNSIITAKNSVDISHSNIESIDKSSKNIKSAGYSVNNYEDMYNLIASNISQKSIEINLKGSSKYALTKPIVFNNSIYASSITINGNGHTLDAKNKNIFMNISYAKTVTINNLTIINTNYKKSSTFSNNGTLTLNNCNFTDNSIKEGGLIFNRATLYMDNCRIRNSIDDLEEFIISYPNAKGTIINYGAAYITNSNISNIASSSASFVDNYAYLYLKSNYLNNSASDFGSIVSHIYSVAVMEDNIFSNCTSTYGGVISNHAVITVKNNKFYSNRASVGGVLYNNGNVTFTSNLLRDNEASLAACIYNEAFADKNTGDVYGFINCTKNTFTSNKASIGAVLSNYASVNFEDNTVNANLASDEAFFENDGKSGGTAIIDNNAWMNIRNNKFNSNIAKSCAVLYNRGNVSFVKNNLTSNRVLDNDSFVIENSGRINITNSYFNNNTDNLRDMLIYSSNKNYNISGNTYLNNRLNNSIKTSIVNNTIRVQVKLRDIYNSTVYNGSVVLYSNGRLNNNASLTNGVANVDVLTKNVYKTNNNMTLNYVSLDKHYLNTTTNFKYNSNFTSYVTVNNINDVTAGCILTVTANILDKNGKPINEGHVIFKYNGLTIRDNSSQTVKVDVKNGKVTYKYAIANNTKTSNATMEVVYTGTARYEESRMMKDFKVINKATIVVTTNQTTVKMDEKIKFIATVKWDSKVVTKGFVIFKINGVTVKDAKNNTVKAYLKNGVASYDFTIPDGWSAKPNKLTAVYSELTYTRLENKTYFSLNKTQSHFNLTNITGRQNKTVTIKGGLLDEYDHSVCGTSTAIIKIDGVSYLNDNGKVKVYAIVNGTVNINFRVPVDLKKGNHTIEVVTGTRNAYIGTRTKIILTVQ